MDPRYKLAERRLRDIKSVLLVGSGKGGVGKSLVSVTIALGFAESGFKVGLFDADLHGPTSFRIIGATPICKGTKDGIQPSIAYDIKTISVGLFASNDALTFRSDSKENLLLDLFAETNWGELDLLVVDLPPGTGDEVLTTIRVFKDKAKGIVVSTPSILSTMVVRRLISLFKNEGIEILGLIENMAYINCNGKIIRPFGMLSDIDDVKVLASLPIDPKIEEYIIKGKNVLDTPEYGKAAKDMIKKLQDLI